MFQDKCCIQMPDFWNKLSWGLCVIPLCCNAYCMNERTHITQLVTYLGSPIKKPRNLALFWFPSFYSSCCILMPDFWNKWSWGLCVITLWWNTYIVNNWTHTTYLVMYLGSPVKKKSEFAAILVFQLSDKLLHPASRCPTFEINGHDAFVWYQYDGIQILWTIGPILPVW